MATSKALETSVNYNILHYLRHMPFLKWTETIIGEDLDRHVCVATAIIQCISLTHYCKTFVSSTIQVEAVYLANAIKFLSKDDSFQTFEALRIMLEDLTHCKRVIVLELNLAVVQLVVVSQHILKTIVVASMSIILLHLKSNLSNQKIFVSVSKLIMLTLTLLPKCPFSEFYLYTLLTLVKKFKVTKRDQKTILSNIFPYLNQTCFKESEICANDLAIYIIRKMKVNSKIRLFNKINEYSSWCRGDCAIVFHLINNWPKHIPLDLFLSKAASRLATIMCDLPFTHCVLNIMKASTKHMSFKTWNEDFLHNIMYSPYFEEGKEVFVMAFSECISLGVKCFGSSVYEYARTNLLTYFASLTLLYSVQEGCVNVRDYQDDINQLLRVPDAIIRQFIFKALCTFNYIDAELTIWHIENVKYYLQNVEDKEHFSLKHLNCFLSHLIVKANNILRYGKHEKIELEDFVNFSIWLNEFIMSCLLSDTLKKIEVGDNMFFVTQSVFEEDSDSLLTLYERNETQRYDTKKSLFYNHLVELNKFLYNKVQVHNEVLKSFLLSKTLCRNLISFLEKWYFLNGPCDSNYIQLIYDTGLRLLDQGCDQVATKKGAFCLHLVLLHKTVYLQDPKSFVERIFNKWRPLMEKLKHTKMNNKKTSTILGYTVCVFFLLNQNYIDGIISDECCDNLIECCKCIIKKYLNIPSTKKESNASFNAMIENIGETILTALNIVVFILRNKTNEKSIKVAVELANQIKGEYVGEVTIFKQNADVRSSIVELLKTLYEAKND